MNIAIVNFKGGVGKTTTAVTVGQMLSWSSPVLIVDCDPQGHVAYSLGRARGPGLWMFLTGYAPTETVITTARPGLDLIANEVQSGGMLKSWIVAQPYREQILSSALGQVAARYEYILLDAGPSFDALAINVIHAADVFIVPVAVDSLAMAGLSDFLQTVYTLRSQAGKPGASIVILPTMFDARTKESKSNLDLLREKFGEAVAPPIPRDVKAREAPAFGKTIIEYAPASPVAGAYYLAAEHIGARFGLKIPLGPQQV